MVLGFISLILTFGQSYISKVCISISASDTMLPCPVDVTNDPSTSSDDSSEEEHRRRFLLYDHGLLSSTNTTNMCGEGKEPLISVDGLHQLHILIFFLAVFHVIYSLVTMMLGRLHTVSGTTVVGGKCICSCSRWRVHTTTAADSVDGEP